MAESVAGHSWPVAARSLKRTLGPLSSQALSVISVFERHLQDLDTLSTSTRRAYLTDIRHFVCWAETNPGSRTFSPEDLTTPLLLRYLEHLEHLTLRPASLNRALAGLKRFCAWVKKSGLVSDDQALSVPFLRLLAAPAPPRCMSDPEEAALTRSVAQHGSLRDQALLAVMLHAGLNGGETCQLLRRDLTLTPDGGSLRVTGKGNRGREVPLNSAARTALRGYLLSCRPVPPEQIARLFSSTRQGGALTQRAVGHLIRKYALLAHLELSPHDLRHRFGYVMAEQVSLHRLGQLMGHASLDTTALYLSSTDLEQESEKTAWL